MSLRMSFDMSLRSSDWSWLERFIQEGNRALVSKATHSRNWEGPVLPRVRR